MKLHFISAAVGLALAMGSVASSHAANIGVFGSNYNGDVVSFLTAAGHTVTNFDYDITAANLSGLDAAILLRVEGNAALSNFVFNGGKLITEWSSATYGMGLLGGSADFVGYVATGSIVEFTSAGLAQGLGAGIGGSYSDGPRTEFFYNISNVGTGTALATRYGSTDTAIAGGAYGTGYVYVNAYDWADFYSPLTNASYTQQLVLNQLSVAAVPEPESYALLLAGLGIMGVVAKRRKARA